VPDPTFGLVTPSLPALPPSTPLSEITSHLSLLRQNAMRPSPPPNLTISSVGPLGESRGAQPVLPPGGGLAIAAVGRARWEVEWAAEGKIWDMTAEEVERKGTRAVLRCPVGWSGDHRVVSPLLVCEEGIGSRFYLWVAGRCGVDRVHGELEEVRGGAVEMDGDWWMSRRWQV